MCLQYGFTASFSYSVSQAAVNKRSLLPSGWILGVLSFGCLAVSVVPGLSPCPGLPGCFLAFLRPVLFPLGALSGSGTVEDNTVCLCESTHHLADTARLTLPLSVVLVLVRVFHPCCFQVHGTWLGEHYVAVRSGSLESSDLCPFPRRARSTYCQRLDGIKWLWS